MQDALKPFRVIVPIVGFLAAVPYLAIQLIGGGIIIEQLTDGAISSRIGSCIMLFMMFFYGCMGGLRTVVWTDTIQGLMMFFGMWIGGAYMAYQCFHGPSDLWAQAMQRIPQHLTLPGATGQWNWVFVLTTGMMIGLGMFPGSACMWMRIYCAKTLKSFKMAQLFNPFLIPVATLIAIIPLGIGGVMAYPDIAKPDGLILQVLADYTPAVVVGLFFACVCAGAMSTADSNMHAMSAIITVDVCQAFFKVSEGRTIQLIGRISMILCGIASLLVSFIWPGLIYQLGFFALSWGAQLVPITVATIYWKRCTKWGGFWGTVAGLVSVTLFNTVMPLGIDVDPGMVACGINAAVLVAVSLASPRNDNLEELQGKMVQKYEEIRLKEEEMPVTAVGSTCKA